MCKHEFSDQNTQHKRVWVFSNHKTTFKKHHKMLLVKIVNKQLKVLHLQLNANETDENIKIKQFNNQVSLWFQKMGRQKRTSFTARPYSDIQYFVFVSTQEKGSKRTNRNASKWNAFIRTKASKPKWRISGIPHFAINVDGVKETSWFPLKCVCIG